MKYSVLCAITCASALLLSSCYYHDDISDLPIVENENQYVHQFLLQNESHALISLMFLNENGSGSGYQAFYGKYMCAEVIINDQEEISENTLLTLMQGVPKNTTSVNLQIQRHGLDEEGWTHTAWDDIKLSSDVEISPYWSENYILSEADSIPDYSYRYVGKVKEEHIKNYVLSVTDDYLMQLKKASE